MARHGKSAAKFVKSGMRRRKHGTLRSGRRGKGGLVKSRKQAIAIGFSDSPDKWRQASQEKLKLKSTLVRTASFEYGESARQFR